MKWTEEQTQAINLRNCNILVSAAAGSGKTAVLIERILSRILDKDHPVNVDEFLIVTFTKAAASQMKERLQRALEAALEKDPDNEHLQQQIMLVPMAQISTIHSFCSYVIQNYFHRTGVDPSYRVASESELGLLKSDVMKEMLEEKYAAQPEEFMQMAVMSRFVKSDAEIESLTLMLYEKAMSHPFPKKFIGEMRNFVGMETVEQLRESEFIRMNQEYLCRLLGGICEEYHWLMEQCEVPGGPFWYKEVLQDDLEQLERVAAGEEYEEMGRKLGLIVFKRLPAKRNVEVDAEIKETVKNMRDAVKGMIKTLQQELFDCPLEKQLEQLQAMRATVEPFLDLTLEFMDRYRQKKSEKTLVDFNDLEQMALDILIQDVDGEIRQTEAAKELAEQFAEIMIDEYQDSNLVQDLLLGSVSAGNNLFMVGDIKQSIYRFRMACPELFLDKLYHYSDVGGEPNRLVNLSQNFRSRDSVLDGTNAVFAAIMHRELGGVEYDESAKLRAGAEFPQTDLRTARNIDIYAVSGKDDGSYEGKIIAEKIKEYTGDDNPLYVYEDGKYRRAEYGDIVILARSTKAIGAEIYDALAAEGIPAYMENTSGFFDTREISIMVNLFHIIDNPRQDIPLAAVMRSPMFDFSDDELAVLRGKEKEKDFYESLLLYSGEDVLQEKVKHFLTVLEGLRGKMTYQTVADMIQEIYDQTKIDCTMMAMPGGARRKANLDMLMETAREFDSTSYRGLYQFVRYLSNIRKREEDMGEANLLGDKENVVRIMTIHKSKGLEFPVCFLAGMGRKLTGAGGSSFLAVNPSVGIASPVMDQELGIAVNNTFYRSLNRMNLLEDLGEELRVLYVAMTRAKEKLVLTGCKAVDKVPVGTDYFQLIRAQSYFDWVLPAVAGNPLFRIQWVEKEEVEKREIHRQAEGVVDEVMLNNFDTTLTYDKETKEMLTFIEEHTVEEIEEIPTKLSVSEIKRKSMEEHEDSEFTVLGMDALENQSPVPAFARTEQDENQALAGAGYGTVWHQVMAGIDFSHSSSEKEVEIELQAMVKSGRVREEDLNYINLSKLMKFFNSALGQEMRRAKEEGTLFREQPFVIGVMAKEVLPDTENTDTVLVQGIIDAFYETEEGIVLMDYKTDHLEPGQESVLMERYYKQMELYARALTGITGKPVVKKVLYSFSLNETVEM